MPSVSISGQPPYAKKLIVGAEWTTTSSKEFKATRKTLQADGREWISLASSNPQTKEMVNYGAIAVSELPNQGRAISLAAWLANSFRNGTVLAVEEVTVPSEGESAFWLCVINDGQVVTGTDVLVDDWETATSIAEGTLEALGAENVGFVGESASRLAISTAEGNSSPLADVLSKSAIGKSRFSNSKSGNLAAMATLVIGVAVVGGGAGYYWYQGQAADTEIAEREKRRRQSQLEDARQEYQQILDRVAQMESAGNTLESVWQGILRGTEVSIRGWKLDTVTCSEGRCEVLYQNTDLTLPSALKAGIGHRCESLEISRDGTSATCTTSYSSQQLITGQAGHSVSPDQIDRILLEEDDLSEIQSQFMTVARMGTGTAYALNEAISYPFNGSRFLPQVEMFDQGEWGLSIPIRLYRPVARFLSEHPAMALSQITMNWGPQIVQLQGLYFSSQNEEVAQ